VPEPFATVVVRYGGLLVPDGRDEVGLGRALAGALDDLGARGDAVG
jgi:hypothetical protein